MQIRTVDLKLVGVQGILDPAADFSADLQALWRKVTSRVGEVRHLSAPARAVGYWHFVDDRTRVYWAGILVDSLDGFRWDRPYGWVAWAPGLTTFAAFREPNGAEGTVAHTAETYGAIGRAGYTYDHRFIGDFEVVPLAWKVEGHYPDDGEHEVWIPVVAKCR